MHIIKLAMVLFVFITPINVYAYVGPGLGLGAIGAFFGIILAIILALIGVFWYPIKRMFKRNELGQEESEDLRDNE